MFHAQRVIEDDEDVALGIGEGIAAEAGEDGFEEDEEEEEKKEGADGGHDEVPPAEEFGSLGDGFLDVFGCCLSFYDGQVVVREIKLFSNQNSVLGTKWKHEAFVFF